MLPWHTTSMWDHPEDFGMKLLSWIMVDEPGPEGVCTGAWNKIGVWETTEGQFLIGNDAGCDCKIPFENTRVEQLTPFETAGELYDFVADAWQTFDTRTVDEGYSKLGTGIIFG